MKAIRVRGEAVDWADIPLGARIEAKRQVLERSLLPSDARLTAIYCIQEGRDGPIKIGYSSSNLQNRLNAMQTGNSRKLTLLAAAMLPRRLEKEIHYELDCCRIGRSEWFSPVADTYEAVRAIEAYGVAQTANTTRGNIGLVEPKDSNIHG